MVLGAGIAGVSTALQLSRLGKYVAVVDRKRPAEEASYGNAGLICRNGFVPQPLPATLRNWLMSMLRQSGPYTCDMRQLMRLRGWLARYRVASEGHGAEIYSREMDLLRGRAIEEHLELARIANADRFYRESGTLSLYRNEATCRRTEPERAYARVYGVDYAELTAQDVAHLEPGLNASPFRSVLWPENWSVSNPAAVVDSFWRTFVQQGGSFFHGDALKLQRQRGGWILETLRGTLFARHAVVALGAWSQDLLKKMEEEYPVAVKRGYHLHFRPVSGASISRPVVDVESGSVLTPTERGIRVTTGLELADRDAPVNQAILRRARTSVSKLFPLWQEIEADPWMGCRTCLPDSLPVVGASPKTDGLWLNFGHGNDGFGLGPVTGRLLAEMIVGEQTILKASALSPLRFWQ